MEHLHARFYKHPVLNVVESRKDKENRYGDDVIMVELTTKGARGESISKIATDEHKEAFPRAWAEFNGEAYEHAGTELKVLDFSLGRIKELNALGIYTVEELAQVSDGNIARLREGNQLKNKAVKFLEGQQLSQMVSMDEFQAMQQQLEEMKAQLNKEQEKPRRGRPPKHESNAS